jgi:hypothetical protein
MPPPVAGTTLSRLWPPVSVSRSEAEKLGRLLSAGDVASALASALALYSATLDSQETKNTPSNASLACTRCRSDESSLPASLADRNCTSALAVWSRDSSWRAKAGARPLTRSARSASRSVTMTSTAIQLAAMSAINMAIVTTSTMRRRIDVNETGPVCIFIDPCRARPWPWSLLGISIEFNFSGRNPRECASPDSVKSPNADRRLRHSQALWRKPAAASARSSETVYRLTPRRPPRAAPSMAAATSPAAIPR